MCCASSFVAYHHCSPQTSETLSLQSQPYAWVVLSFLDVLAYLKTIFKIKSEWFCPLFFWYCFRLSHQSANIVNIANSVDIVNIVNIVNIISRDLKRPQGISGDLMEIWIYYQYVNCQNCDFQKCQECKSCASIGTIVGHFLLNRILVLGLKDKVGLCSQNTKVRWDRLFYL